MSTDINENEQNPISKRAKFDAQSQLEYAVQLSAKQDQIMWTVFGVFWPINILLLIAMFQSGNIPSRTVGFIVSFVGIVLSILWSLMQGRSIAYLYFYDDLIHRIEEEYIDIPLEVTLSGHLNKVLYDHRMEGTSSIRPIMKYSGFVTAFLWFISLILFIFFL